ncbi:unnamed protein product [Spodoptera littoralis]|uniref:Monocarboxylate transporter n=1 Tax=Spodoptera littoralis TaxID=7109 RepID=A0A9P0I487_SPOLI|nr:unnamed protein product [Spodoptera littoralis]
MRRASVYSVSEGLERCACARLTALVTIQVYRRPKGSLAEVARARVRVRVRVPWPADGAGLVVALAVGLAAAAAPRPAAALPLPTTLLYQLHLLAALWLTIGNTLANLRPFVSTSRKPKLLRDGWPDGEEESSGGALRERELRSLHRTVPALRRRELDTRAIKHHFYPEGGWGWIVCGAAFLAHLLSTGLQLAYGALHVYALRHLGPSADHAVWAGALCVGVSRAAGAFAAGRRRSPRLVALLGGLLLPLACLFTSFATQLHQTLLSYGVVLGVGCGFVRESAGLVLGAYFRDEDSLKLGWRLGLQAVTGVLVLAFFLSAVYRSASLYHPQRRAILHLKNQRRKVKEKKGLKRGPIFDLSPLHSRPAKVLLLAAGIAAFGLYTPVFFLALQGFQEGLEESALVLLQTFLGFAAVLGCAGFGLVLVRPSAQCLVSKQYLCQTAMVGIGISMLALSSVEGYHGYVLFAWMYGLCLGGYLYSMKMLTMERVRGRHFTRVWGFVQGAEAIPVMVGVPVTARTGATAAGSRAYTGGVVSMCDTATSLRTCLVRLQRWWGDGVLCMAGAYVWLAAAKVAVVRGAAGPRVLLGSAVSGLLQARAAAASVALCA